LSDRLGNVFAALSDPTRRTVIEALLRDGSTSVPALAERLPISRQGIAKHLASLTDAGLVERAPAAGREVRYRLRPGGLRDATAWLQGAEDAWDERLERLRGSFEQPPARRGRP
jgi:DNA-binding transcriptional ArsR family regulator